MPETVHTIFVTHCAQGDSVQNNPGYSVRASSTRDPELLRFAFSYPGYELPLELWGTGLLPVQAPRRLARIAAPGNRVALIHTTYLEHDTLGRPQSYFTHVQILPRLSAIESLKSWGSNEWSHHYDQGKPKDLPERTSAIGPGRIHDTTVSAFLKGTLADPIDTEHLATLCLPNRLKSAEANTRKELLALTMAACLRARDPNAGPRARVHLRAEPGLAALLLYATCRLTPEGWLDDLTFTTYEAPHGSFRQFRDALVLCTYTATKPLDPDIGKSRGFSVDTIEPARSSDDLRDDIYRRSLELVEVLAHRNWADVDGVRRQLFPAETNPRTSTVFASGMTLCEPLVALEAGQATKIHLLTLKRSPVGRLIHDAHPDLVWKRVRELCLEDAEIRREYLPLLGQHREKDLEPRAITALSQAQDSWPRWWTLLREILGVQKRAQRERLEFYLDKAKDGVRQAPWPFRLSILRDWNAIAESQSAPHQVRCLFVQAPTFTEIRDLQRESAFPHDWAQSALWKALQIPTTGEEIANALPTDEGLLALLNGGNPSLTQAEGIATRLLPKDTTTSESLERVLRLWPQVPGSVVQARIREAWAGAKRTEWQTFWLRKERLKPLVEALGRPQPSAAWTCLLSGTPEPAELERLLSVWPGTPSKEALGTLQHALRGPQGEAWRAYWDTPERLRLLSDKVGCDGQAEALATLLASGLRSPASLERLMRAWPEIPIKNVTDLLWSSLCGPDQQTCKDYWFEERRLPWLLETLKKHDVYILDCLFPNGASEAPHLEAVLRHWDKAPGKSVATVVQKAMASPKKASWLAHWSSEERLLLLGSRLAKTPVATTFWEAQVARITWEVLLPKSSQIALFKALQSSSLDCGYGPGSEVGDVLGDWETLRNALSPGNTPSPRPDAIRHARDKRGLTGSEFWPVYIATLAQDYPADSLEAGAFFTTFKGLYLPQRNLDGYFQLSKKFLGILNSRNEVPEARRHNYQAVFFHSCVEDTYRISVAEDCYKTRLISSETYRAIDEQQKVRTAKDEARAIQEAAAADRAAEKRKRTMMYAAIGMVGGLVVLLGIVGVFVMIHSGKNPDGTSQASAPKSTSQTAEKKEKVIEGKTGDKTVDAAHLDGKKAASSQAKQSSPDEGTATTEPSLRADAEPCARLLEAIAQDWKETAKALKPFLESHGRQDLTSTMEVKSKDLEKLVSDLRKEEAKKADSVKATVDRALEISQEARQIRDQMHRLLRWNGTYLPGGGDSSKQVLTFFQRLEVDARGRPADPRMLRVYTGFLVEWFGHELMERGGMAPQEIPLIRSALMNYTLWPKENVLVATEMEDHKALTTLLSTYLVHELVTSPGSPRDEAERVSQGDRATKVLEEVRKIIKPKHWASSFSGASQGKEWQDLKLPGRSREPTPNRSPYSPDSQPARLAHILQKDFEEFRDLLSLSKLDSEAKKATEYADELAQRVGRLASEDLSPKSVSNLDSAVKEVAIISNEITGKTPESTSSSPLSWKARTYEELGKTRMRPIFSVANPAESANSKGVQLAMSLLGPQARRQSALDSKDKDKIEPVRFQQSLHAFLVENLRDQAVRHGKVSPKEETDIKSVFETFQIRESGRVLAINNNEKALDYLTREIAFYLAESHILPGKTPDRRATRDRLRNFLGKYQDQYETPKGPFVGYETEERKKQTLKAFKDLAESLKN